MPVLSALELTVHKQFHLKYDLFVKSIFYTNNHYAIPNTKIIIFLFILNSSFLSLRITNLWMHWISTNLLSFSLQWATSYILTTFEEDTASTPSAVGCQRTFSIFLSSAHIIWDCRFKEFLRLFELLGSSHNFT